MGGAGPGRSSAGRFAYSDLLCGQMGYFDPANVPPGREYCSLWKDPNSGLIVMFGGNSGNGKLRDLWLFDPREGSPSRYQWQYVGGGLGVDLPPNTDLSWPGSWTLSSYWNDFSSFYLWGGLSKNLTAEGRFPDVWSFSLRFSNYTLPACNIDLEKYLVPPTEATVAESNNTVTFARATGQQSLWTYVLNETFPNGLAYFEMIGPALIPDYFATIRNMTRDNRIVGGGWNGSPCRFFLCW
jgi:hypothetical protein